MGNILDGPNIRYDEPPDVSPQKATDAPLIEIGEGQPLDYLLAVMRHPDETPARRMSAAEKAAPYVHPKLAASVVIDGSAADLTKWIESARQIGRELGRPVVELEAMQITHEDKAELCAESDKELCVKPE